MALPRSTPVTPADDGEDLTFACTHRPTMLRLLKLERLIQRSGLEPIRARTVEAASGLGVDYQFWVKLPDGSLGCCTHFSGLIFGFDGTPEQQVAMEAATQRRFRSHDLNALCADGKG